MEIIADSLITGSRYVVVDCNWFEFYASKLVKILKKWPLL